jgi:hypothetical protein
LSANWACTTWEDSRASPLLQWLARYKLPAVVVCAVLTACNSGDANDKPYLAFAGGGFIFNYRLATADYGFVARVMRIIPPGSLIEAEFENPAGGAPIVLRQSTRAGRSSYVFRTPSLQGVRANRDYRVVLRLLDPEHQEFASYWKDFRSSADQNVLPETPPVVGPGYQRAPTTITSRP